MGFNSSYQVVLSPLQLTNHGICVIGAGDYPAEVFPRAIDLVSELELADLVTHEYSLDRYPDAFAALGGVPAGGVMTTGYTAMKVVIRSDPGEPGADGWPGAMTRR